MITQGILTIKRENYNRHYKAFYADSIEELATSYTGIDVWNDIPIGNMWKQHDNDSSPYIIRYKENVLLFRPDGKGINTERIAFVVDSSHPVVCVID